MTTYKDSGVDLELYEDAMQRLPKLMHRTFSPRVIRNDGGFAGLYALDFASKLFARNYKEPVLVSGTDGVGTKLKVATLCGRHDTIGIDLVAMCVNDCLCTGAEPLFFLDYIAMSRDNPPLLEAIVRGVSDGCVQADCALLGGETAIMPDIYHGDEYDAAGFCVGVVDRQDIIDGKAIEAGDVLIGVGSSGFHSNGYSLVRKVVFDKAKLSVDARVDELQSTVGEALLTPTLIYAKLVRTLLNEHRSNNAVHGIAHITGGGLLENTQRILPPNVDLEFDRNGWEVPALFHWLQRIGEIPSNEMDHVFNMGIGLVLCVRKEFASEILKKVEQEGYRAFQIGNVVLGSAKSRYTS